MRTCSYGIAQRMLGDDGTAEDVTQAAFLKLWTNPQAFRGGNFAGWLARVTRNCALDALRREMVRRTGTRAADAALEAWTDDAVLAELDGVRVRWAPAQLPRENREIARITALPLGTVKTRIRTGLLRLRQELREGSQ
jgi:DNA-directed RNA polymerase specialized sigma24 family protein